MNSHMAILLICTAIVVIAGCLVFLSILSRRREHSDSISAIPRTTMVIPSPFPPLSPEIKRVQVSHLAAVTEDGVELGDVWIGPHNMRLLQAGRAENSESIKIYIKKAGVAFGSAFVDFEGNQYGAGPFPRGSEDMKVGESLEFLPGGLRLGVPGAGGDKNIRLVLW